MLSSAIAHGLCRLLGSTREIRIPEALVIKPQVITGSALLHITTRPIPET
jgi:hypothetical protein